MLVGYARVSTQDQKPELQLDALKAAGCEKVFVDYGSGQRRPKHRMRQVLQELQEGDTLVVVRISVLALRPAQLFELTDSLSRQGIYLRSLSEMIDTVKPDGKELLAMMCEEV